MNRRDFKARGLAPRGGGLRRRAVQWCALAALFGAGIAPAQIQIAAQAIAGGGGTIRSNGGCYVLESTLGEPAGGRASGGAFAVTAGFWAGPGSARRDTVFHNGFQGCN